MILADGGVVRIDLADKMDKYDRIDIRETIKLQNISIAEATKQQFCIR